MDLKRDWIETAGFLPSDASAPDPPFSIPKKSAGWVCAEGADVVTMA